MACRLATVMIALALGACATQEPCGAGAMCACTTCPDGRLSALDSGSTVDYPQGYRVEVTATLSATGAPPAALVVTDPAVLKVEQTSSAGPLQLVTVQPGRARISIPGTAFAVDVVVHRWPFGRATQVLNPYNPTTVKAAVGDELGVLFYGDGAGVFTIVSSDSSVVVLDSFTVIRRQTEFGHYGVLRTRSPGRSEVVVTAPGATLFPISVSVARN